MKRFVKLNKEYRDLEKIVTTRNEYVNTLNGINEARQMLDTEQDPEMREIAREELDACNGTGRRDQAVACSERSGRP